MGALFEDVAAPQVCHSFSPFSPGMKIQGHTNIILKKTAVLETLTPSSREMS